MIISDYALEIKLSGFSVYEQWVRDWLVKILEYLNNEPSLNININANLFERLDNAELAEKIYNYIEKWYMSTNSKNNFNDLIKEIKLIARKLGVKPSELNKISLILYHRPFDRKKLCELCLYRPSICLLPIHLTSNTAQLLTGDSVFKEYKTKK
ncbi:hypothetical protein EFN50_08170 [Leuconostoc mesenteroides]|nr:hypothetical protein [Leuconostoc mesenteroides]